MKGTVAHFPSLERLNLPADKSWKPTTKSFQPPSAFKTEARFGNRIGGQVPSSPSVWFLPVGSVFESPLLASVSLTDTDWPNRVTEYGLRRR